MTMNAFVALDGELAMVRRDMPVPQKDEVLINVEAFGVNRADLLQLAGKYPPPKGASDILGLEVAGLVVSVGDNVDETSVGLSVAAMLSGGGYAEYVTVPKDHIIPIPDAFSTIEFAAVPEVYLTALQALYLIGKCQANKSVLIHAGASGLGSAATLLSKALNYRVSVTCSSAKVDFCRSLSADYVIDYQTSDFVQELKDIGFYPDVILDVIGEDHLNRNLDILAKDGTIVQLAMMKGRFSEPVDIAKLLLKRASIVGSTLRNRDDSYKAELTRLFNERCLPLFTENKLRPIIQDVFEVEHISSAHQLMSQNKTKGKLVVKW